MIPNPWVVLALLLAWGTSCGVAYYRGGEAKEDEIAAENAKHAAEDAERQADVAKIMAAKKAANAARNRQLENEVNDYVSTPAAHDRCFDAVGLRVFNAIVSGMPMPGGRPQPVPGAAPDRKGSDARGGAGRG